METRLNHALDLAKSRDSKSRERFVSGLRAYVLLDLAGELREDYEQSVLPQHLKRGGEKPADGPAVHDLLKPSPTFQFYSSLRCATQEMVWNAVLDSVEENSESLNRTAAKLTANAKGSLELDDTLDAPRYADAVDVHLMPGNYSGQEGATLEAGAVYDNGLNVFAFGAMGAQLNDIGWSMAKFLHLKFPDLAPREIVDVGCTIGHNTLPWKSVYPDAKVTGLDLAASCLRYAHARAEAMNVEAHFRQASADCLPFADNSVDIVFSSMFLHELPTKMIHAYFAEAHRVLRPGGVLLNMELPPNEALEPYDAFYLDWDCYYNNEPFYKGFRDQDYTELTVAGGFERDNFFQGIMPRFTYGTPDEFRAAVAGGGEFDDNTGRLSDQIQWYGFGSVKAGG